MVRLNPNLLSTVLAGIEQNKQNSDTLLQELSSGYRVNNYSDDPAAAAAMVTNHAEYARNDQFTRNISDLTAVLQTGDSTLSSVTNALTQAITLGVEGANGTNSDSDRQSIAQQVDGIQQQILSLANSSISGQYIFGGTATGAPPFVADNTSASGVTYNGNTGVNNIELQPGQSIAINVPGSTVFSNAAGNVFQALKDLSTALQTNSNIPGAVSELRTAFNQVSTQRVVYGQALNQMTAASTQLSQDQVQLKSQQTDLVGADLAKTATDLSQVQTAQTALEEAAGKVSTYTLLDFLPNA